MCKLGFPYSSKLPYVVLRLDHKTHVCKHEAIRLVSSILVQVRLIHSCFWKVSLASGECIFSPLYCSTCSLPYNSIAFIHLMKLMSVNELKLFGMMSNSCAPYDHVHEWVKSCKPRELKYVYLFCQCPNSKAYTPQSKAQKYPLCVWVVIGNLPEQLEIYLSFT